MKELVTAAISGIVSPVTNYLGKRVERKQAKDEIKGKVAYAKQTGEHEVAMATEKWDLLSKEGEDKSWKDEYVTVSLVAPINVLVIDSILAAMGYSDGSATTGVLTAMATLRHEVGIPVGELTSLAVAAALSVKLVKGLR